MTKADFNIPDAERKELAAQIWHNMMDNAGYLLSRYSFLDIADAELIATALDDYVEISGVLFDAETISIARGSAILPPTEYNFVK